jgi:hypothetical protein
LRESPFSRMREKVSAKQTDEGARDLTPHPPAGTFSRMREKEIILCQTDTPPLALSHGAPEMLQF